MTGKFLAVTEQRHDARIVGKCRRHVLLNLSDRCVEAPLVVELAMARVMVRTSSCEFAGAFARISAASLSRPCAWKLNAFSRECGLVPGRHLEGAIKDRPRLVKTTDGLE